VTPSPIRREVAHLLLGKEIDRLGIGAAEEARQLTDLCERRRGHHRLVLERSTAIGIDLDERSRLQAAAQEERGNQRRDKSSSSH
jgi:hypothetical protein